MNLRSADFFQMAKAGAEQYRDQVLTKPLVTSVVVTSLYSFGGEIHEAEDSYPRCHADQFDPGILTITAIDDGYVMRRYHADQWKNAVARYDGGHIAYLLTHDSEPQTQRQRA